MKGHQLSVVPAGAMAKILKKKFVSKAYQYHKNLAKGVQEHAQFDFRKLEKLHKRSPLASLRWAFRGLYYAYRTQRNFRIELYVTFITLVSAVFFRISKTEWSIILFCIFQVLGAELTNTALEYMVDLYERKFNSLAMMAKDIAAGFVLLSAIHAVIQGSLIFGSYFWHFIQGWLS